MIKMSMHKIALAATLAAFFLAGCGGGSSSLWPVPERQFGVTEAQVMDASANSGGIVVGAGSGLVVTQIEASVGAPARLVGDSGSIGVDQMWFDVDNLVKVALDLGSDSFDVVYKVEVLNQAENVLLTIDADHPKGELWLDHGRYQLRFTAAGTATDIALGMVWFGGASKLGNAADLQKLLASPVCIDCNLRGANLRQATLRSAILSGADLSSAILTGATLSGAHMTGAGANAANLSSAVLMRVKALNMFLPGVDMQSANLAGATWTDGRVCANESVGECL